MTVVRVWPAIGAAIVSLLLASAAAAQEKRVALVIGNAAYREAPLKNPVNDARAMAVALKRAGFEVLLHENLGRAQLADAVGQFGDRLSEGATGLFYFAGHGLQVQGRNYLVPVDARITTENRVRLETLDVEAVLDQMQAARTRVSMVILDACRNNPFERRFRSSGAGLAQINAPTGTLIAYATAPGKVAADGEGANGIYTQELLRALGQPGLRVEDVFKTVRVNVMRQTGEAQVPWETSSLTGDFVFLPGSQPALVAAPAPTTAASGGLSEAVALELAYWQSVAGSQNRGDFEAYLARYPNGTFAELARARIAQLTPRAAATPAARPEPPQQQTVMVAPPPPPTATPNSITDFNGRWRGNNGRLSFRGRVENNRLSGTISCGSESLAISGQVGRDGHFNIFYVGYIFSGYLPTLDVLIGSGSSGGALLNCRSSQIVLERE